MERLESPLVKVSSYIYFHVTLLIIELPGSYSVWTAHNRLAHLDDKRQVIVKNLENKNVNFGGLAAGFLLPKAEAGPTYRQPDCDRLFPGGQTPYSDMEIFYSCIFLIISQNTEGNYRRGQLCYPPEWSQPHPVQCHQEEEAPQSHPPRHQASPLEWRQEPAGPQLQEGGHHH